MIEFNKFFSEWTNKMHLRRALLYMPGDDDHKIEKSTKLSVDVICMDLEDGVATTNKQYARSVVVNSLKTKDFRRSEKLVRINSVSSDFWVDDLHAVIPACPDGIVIPKIESADEVQMVSEMVGELETQNGLIAGGISIMVIIESAVGVVNLSQIASSSSRLVGLIFGAEDLVADLGALRTESANEVLYARSAVVLYAAAYKLQAIDMVYVDYQNEHGLITEAMFGKQLGYSGKQIIHPNQVMPVQNTFTPDQDEIKKALHLLSEFEKHQNDGKGVFSFGGKMVDAPMIRTAELIISKAKAAGVL